MELIIMISSNVRELVSSLHAQSFVENSPTLPGIFEMVEDGDDRVVVYDHKEGYYERFTLPVPAGTERATCASSQDVAARSYCDSRSRGQ